MSEDLHAKLNKILNSDLLAAMFIRLVETETMTEASALKTARKLVADGFAFNAAINAGYDWLGNFESLLEEYKITS